MSTGSGGRRKQTRRNPLRDELTRSAHQIPDQPTLNPIVNVAFNLSRRLEAGDITFDELKALAAA